MWDHVGHGVIKFINSPRLLTTSNLPDYTSIIAKTMKEFLANLRTGQEKINKCNVAKSNHHMVLNSGAAPKRATSQIIQTFSNKVLGNISRVIWQYLLSELTVSN